MKYTKIMDKVRIEDLKVLLNQNPSQEIARSETRYRERIVRLCNQVIGDSKHVILLTGPSASGKTTTAKRIANELQERGKSVVRISLDNFYKNSDELPLWNDGYQNYESIDGLDIPCFQQVIGQLLDTGKADLPIFDFAAGARSAKTVPLVCDSHTFFIIEGIHALNPEISRWIDKETIIKIYISTHSDFLDASGACILNARDLRLTRRIIRDHYYRGTPAVGTLKMWDYVLRGEDLYIRPYRMNADLHINSTHDYEPFLYHLEILQTLAEADGDSLYHETICRLLRAHSHFFDLNSSLIPSSSLIQEFIKPQSWQR